MNKACAAVSLLAFFCWVVLAVMAYFDIFQASKGSAFFFIVLLAISCLSDFFGYMRKVLNDE